MRVCSLIRVYSGRLLERIDPEPKARGNCSFVFLSNTWRTLVGCFFEKISNEPDNRAGQPVFFALLHAIVADLFVAHYRLSALMHHARASRGPLQHTVKSTNPGLEESSAYDDTSFAGV